VRRSAKKLNSLLAHIDVLIEQVGRANPLIASKMIAASALAREESRGGHYRDDFTEMKDKAVSSYITFDMLG
jgi:L-aspartate oxidase